MTAARPPVTHTGLPTPATTGSAAATASSSSFSHLYRRWFSLLLRSYQPIPSSSRSQVGSSAAGGGTASIGRAAPGPSSRRAIAFPLGQVRTDRNGRADALGSARVTRGG